MDDTEALLQKFESENNIQPSQSAPSPDDTENLLSQFEAENNITPKGPDVKQAATQALEQTVSATNPLISALLSGVKTYNKGTSFLSQEGPSGAVRAGYSIKSTPTEKKSYLEAMYGKGNVRMRPMTYAAGEWTEPETQEDLSSRSVIQVNDGKGWKDFDEDALTYKDIADFSGEGLEAAPQLAGAGVAAAIPGAQWLGTPAGQAVLAGAGTVLRKGSSALLPGQKPTISDTAKETAFNAATAYGFGKVAEGLNWAIKNYSPKTEVASHYAKALSNERQAAIITENQRLAKAGGLNLSLGAEADDPFIKSVEMNVSQTPTGNLRAATLADKNIEAAYNHTQKITKMIDSFKKPLSKDYADEVGQRALDMTDNAFNKAFGNLKAQAEKDYKFISTNKEKIVSLDSLKQRLTELSDEYVGLRSALTSGKKIVGESLQEVGSQADDALGILQELADEPGQITIAKAVDALRKLQSMAAGTGKPMFQGQTTGVNRHIAGELAKSIVDDLDNASPLASVNIREALSQANANYRSNMQFVDEIRSSVLGRFFKQKNIPNPSEAYAAVRSMNNTEAKMFTKMADKYSPELLKNVQSAYLRDILDSGFSKSTSKTGRIDFDPYKAIVSFESKFGQQTPERARVFDILFKTGNKETASVRSAVLDAININRLAVSPINAMQTAESSFQAAGSGAATATNVVAGDWRNTFVFGTKNFYKYIAPRFLEKIVFDPEGQAVLRELAKNMKKPASVGFQTAISSYMGLLVKKGLLTDPRVEQEIINDQFNDEGTSNTDKTTAYGVRG